jgi:hypothetical protein
MVADRASELTFSPYVGSAKGGKFCNLLLRFRPNSVIPIQYQPLIAAPHSLAPERTVVRTLLKQSVWSGGENLRY